MIYYVKGDLFSSPAQVLVNTVNLEGVMGKGIAKEFKTLFPDMFKEYQALCEEKRLRPGSLHVYQTVNKWILNFPTKRSWRNKSRLDDIELGLKTFCMSYERCNFQSVAFPQLGCGNGELDWETQVRPLMEKMLKDLPIDIYIHTYDAGQMPEPKEKEAFRAWLRAEPKSLSFYEFWDDVTQKAAGHSNIAVEETEVLDDNLDPVVEQRLSIEVEGITGFITQSQALQLWQKFRTSGLLARSALPDSLEGGSIEALWSLLLELPYIDVTSFTSLQEARRRKQSTSESLQADVSQGLRLIPYRLSSPSAEVTQLCLTEKIAV